LLRVPGYLIAATIDLPKYHPHIIWWLAYISQILKGRTVSDIQKNPPWPIPNDEIITNHLIKELIDEKWLTPNWDGENFEVSQEIRDIFDKEGEVGLAKHFLQYETIKGEWWIDANSGTPLSLLTANQYDIEWTKNKNKTIYEVEIKEAKETLMNDLNLDIITLLKLLSYSDIENKAQINRAFLSSSLKIRGEKIIEFSMYGGIAKESERVLPNRLSRLEPMLWEYAPEVFGKKKRHKRKLFQWNRSIVESFALSLEKFPNHYSQLTGSPYFKKQLEYLRNLIEKKDDWLFWYRTGMVIEPIVGKTDILFKAFSEICKKTNTPRNLDEENNVDRIIFTTSFLNVRNLDMDESLLDCLTNASENTRFLIIYGHANDDPPDKQNRDIKEYLNMIYELEPQLKPRVLITSAKKRSHEKIIISSRGDWMIGSWNPGSSRPNSTVFEVAVRGCNGQFSSKLLNIVIELIEDSEATDFVHKLQTRLESLTYANEPSDKIAEKIYFKLKKATKHLVTLLKKDDSQSNLEKAYEFLLYSIRLCLLPFLKRAHLRLINEHESRDVLITQIRKTNQVIFLSSDRVSKSALDRTLLRDVQGSSGEGKRYLKILWGREWEHESDISKEAHEQLLEAKKAIREASRILGMQLKTAESPMENHSKFALFDGCRGLITSENLLSYGGEKTQYESRELGIFIECIPCIRYIEGKAILHRINHFHPERHESEMSYRPYEWILEGINQYYAFQSIKNELDFDFSESKIIETAIEDSLINPMIDEMDEFDIQMLKQKENYYLNRIELVHRPYIDHLWSEGIRYYLLKPSIQKFWVPYMEEILPNEIENLDFSIIPYLKDNLVPEKKAQLKKEEITGAKELIDDIMNDMILIKKGSFKMGSDKVLNERPVHEVSISEDFYIGKYPVTQELWEKVMGELPFIFDKQKSPNFPIIYVTYNDIQDFLKKLNALPTSGGFDLPTEAQWEYVCRASSEDDYCFGNNPGFGKDPGELERYAWTKRNSKKRLHEVGLLLPNKWGLYDIHGLVYEMVKDGRRVYSNEPITDPIGPIDSDYCVVRGGAWGRFPIQTKPQECHFRCAYRGQLPKIEKSHRESFRLIRKIKRIQKMDQG